MSKVKLVRITTIPLSLEKLLEGQLGFMSDHFEVTAISSEKDRLESFGEAQGISTFCLEMTRKITPLKDIRAVYKLYRFLTKEKPQIVHTHTPKAGIVGMMASYLAGTPHRLHTVAGLPLMEATGLKRSLLNFVERATYRFATKVYPNSNVLQDFILSEKFTSIDKLKVIGEGSSNGIDTNYFSRSQISEEAIQEKRIELSIDKNDFVFVFVGRIVADKGINELIAAFAKIKENHSNVKLLLVGPFEDDLDPVLPETQQAINDWSEIITTGFVSDVRRFFAVSNALVFPSYREGFPNVVMQAAAMELPSIVSNINGCNEIIRHGENGIIVPVKNSLELQNAMEKMLLNPSLTEQLAIASRPSIVDRFERSVMWNALLDEYRSL